MASPQSGSILHYLRQTILRRDGAGLTDGQLLRSYLHHRDEAAFEALVRRHGPMVSGVCRRVLHNLDDADDAFQAVFLVLIRKADSLATREVLGDWLHGVASRTALKARVAAARRRFKEKQVLRCEAMNEPEDRSDWLPLLDREVARLPEKYRLPVVLCDLQGHTRKEAAKQLGWPEGTLSGRLSRAREMLARRLTRCGATLSAGTLTVALTAEASASLPLPLVHSTCKAASSFAVGQAATSVPAHIAALTEGVVKAMLFSKMKNVAALVTVALFLTASVGAWRYAVAEPSEKQHPEAPIASAPIEDEPRILIIPPAPFYPFPSRRFQIELKIMEEKDGQRKVLVEPRLITLEGEPASFASGETKTIQLGSGETEEVLMGTTVRVVVRSDKNKKIRLDLSITRPEQTVHGDALMLNTNSLRFVRSLELGKDVTFRTGTKNPLRLAVSATVREVARSLEENTIAAAEERLRTAEGFLNSNQPEAACYYYQIICRLYPNTLYAERAKKRMAELQKLPEKRKEKPTNGEEKPPVRVGQIFIQGNKKISDEEILKHVALFPGQILTLPDLRKAERNLSRLKGLKNKPTVTIVENKDANGDFKDIRITVEEK